MRGKSVNKKWFIVLLPLIVIFLVILYSSSKSNPIKLEDQTSTSVLPVAPSGREYISQEGYYYAKDLHVRFKLNDTLIQQKLISKLTSDQDMVHLSFSTQALADATPN